MAIQRRAPNDDHAKCQRFVSSPLTSSYADIRVVRHQDTYIAKSMYTPQSIESQIEGQGKWFPDQPSDALPQIDTQLGGRRSVDQSESSPSPSRKRDIRRGREVVRTIVESQPRYASPEATFTCDGWCKHNDIQYANIVSIGCAPQGRCDLMLARSYLYQRVRTCNVLGKAQGVR
jgi:hypothetical protein